MAPRHAPHPEEAATQPSRRTHGAGPAGAPKQVCVGVVTGPHGVGGAVRIKSFTARPEDIAAYGPLADESGRRRLELRLLGAAKGVLIARLSGVDDRNGAEAVRGLRLYLRALCTAATRARGILPRRPDRARSGAGRRDAARSGARGPRFRRRRHARNRARRRTAGDGPVHPGDRSGRRPRCRPAGRGTAAGPARPGAPKPEADA